MLKNIPKLFIEALLESKREHLIRQGKMCVSEKTFDFEAYPLSAVQYKNDSARLERHIKSIADNEYNGSIQQALYMHELFLQRIGAWAWIKKQPKC